MKSGSFFLKQALGLAGVMLALGLWSAAPAAARTFVHVGVGFGLPLVPTYPPPAYYYPPPPPVVYAPPAYYAPPPAYYYPPPPASYAPPPAPPGPECREYQTTTIVDGRPQQTFGTACRQPDGTWHIIN
jgi:hypothetical protein